MCVRDRFASSTRALATRRISSTWATAARSSSTRLAFPPAPAAPPGARPEIAFTADTHSHADYISGSPELAARGATFLASKDAHLAISHRADRGRRRDRPARRADVCTRSRRQVTRPTISPTCFAKTDAPWRCSAVGRSWSARSAAPTCWDRSCATISRASSTGHCTTRYSRCPTTSPVYPTHGAGSFCSAPGALGTHDDDRPRTRNEPDAAQHPTRTPSSTSSLAGLGSFPNYFARLPEVNRLGPRLYATAPTLARLDVDEVRDLRSSEARSIVDVRPIAAFAAGHIPGALSIELRAVFASWLGWLVDPDRPLRLRPRRRSGPRRARAAMPQRRLRTFRRRARRRHGGLARGRATSRRASSWSARRPRADGPRRPATQRVRRRARSGLGAHRTRKRERRSRRLPPGPVTVMCGHGERAMSGASILAARGRGEVVGARAAVPTIGRRDGPSARIDGPRARTLAADSSRPAREPRAVLAARRASTRSSAG